MPSPSWPRIEHRRWAGWRRRPFFYAALIGLAVLVTADRCGHTLRKPLAPLPAPLMDERSVFLGGTILSEVEERSFFDSQRSYFVLEARRFWTEAESKAHLTKTKVRVSWQGAPKELAYGTELVVEGSLREIPSRTNPGGFDARAYWERQGVTNFLVCSDDARFKILRRGLGSRPRQWAIALKQHFSARFSADFPPDQAAFLKALFLGERSDMDQDFKDLFLNTGTSHILAVSGFNVVYLIAVGMLLLRWVPVSRDLKTSLLLLLIWGYCLLVGWQAPVMRATIMVSVFLLGQILGRRTDALNSLGLAACILMAVQPLVWQDIGFQLSFVAVWALIVWTPVFAPKTKPLPEKRDALDWISREGGQLFWSTVTAYFATLPIVVQNFYMITPYVFAANGVVIPGVFLLFLLWVPYTLLPQGWAIAGAMKLLMGLLVRGLFFLESLPGAVWVVGQLSTLLFLFLCAGLAWIFTTRKIVRRRTRLMALVVFCLILFSAQEILRRQHHEFRMTAFDVGQGDAIFFEFSDGRNLLVDGGGSRMTDHGRWTLMPYLRSRGIRTIDNVMISHPQDDHIGGLRSVFDHFKVKRLVYSGISHDSQTWLRLLRSIQNEDCEVMVAARGSDLTLSPRATARIFHPSADFLDEKDLNNSSLVARLETDGISVLLTGDIGEEAMGSILHSGASLASDILKVPHHGAKTAERGARFFAETHPRYSVISAGKRNPFGHPTASTLNALDRVSGRVCRTDLEGAIVLALEGGKLRLDSRQSDAL